MKEIIKLILKYHFTIIFILLEVLSFSLIVLHNNYQRTVFSGYTASFFGTISSVVTRVDDYFYLKVTNEKLVAENTELRNEIEKLKLLNRIVMRIHYGPLPILPMSIMYTKQLK